MPSLVNTLRSWHWAVRGLMKSRVPISCQSQSGIWIARGRGSRGCGHGGQALVLGTAACVAPTTTS